ncbi:MAG: S-layer homology domain-containing protein [Clostridia bacterium]|nr:S-layer homology domain-containing protein [Clostridia bacterium]
MKKTLSVLLTVVMLLGLVPMSAFAAEAHNGPADVPWAFISIYYEGEEPGDEHEGTGAVYSENTVHNDAVAGATYDLESNTLTLSNYKHPENGLSVNMMGDDFKLEIVGECELCNIAVWGDGWGGSITITGTGTLTVNKDSKIDSAIVLFAESVEASLTVDSNVTVNLYGKKGVFYSSANALSNPEDVVIAANGQELFELNSGIYNYEYSEIITAYEILGSDEEGTDRGYATTKADDPDGFYATSIWTSSLGEKEYHVTKLVYSEEYGVYFEDPYFGEEYANKYGEVALTEEEFKDAGFSMTVSGKQLSTIFFFDGDNAASGPRLIKADDADSIYMLDHQGYSYTDINDGSTYTFKGTIYKLKESEHGFEIDSSFTPVEIGKTDYEALPAGFTVVMDEEYEPLYLKGSFEEYTGNIYVDDEGNEYVVYNNWTDGQDHKYVYAITEVEDVPGCYVATEYVEDIAGVEDHGYTEVMKTEPSEFFEITTDVTEFTFEPDGEVPPPLAPSFPDVKSGAWYYDAAQYCAQKGYISGYANGNFGPNDNLKRQDFVVILSKIAGADLDKYAKMTPKLKDVKKGAYYAAAVNWAVDNNIIAGYANGNFGVNDNITREQVATILYRYMGSPEIKDVDKTLAKFKDVNRISSFAKTAVAWAVQNNVISGMADGRVAPTEGAARAQIASIIMRMDQQGMFNKA